MVTIKTSYDITVYKNWKTPEELIDWDNLKWALVEEQKKVFEQLVIYYTNLKVKWDLNELLDEIRKKLFGDEK